MVRVRRVPCCMMRSPVGGAWCCSVLRCLRHRASYECCLRWSGSCLARWGARARGCFRDGLCCRASGPPFRSAGRRLQGCSGTRQRRVRHWGARTACGCRCPPRRCRCWGPHRVRPQGTVACIRRGGAPRVSACAVGLGRVHVGMHVRCWVHLGAAPWGVGCRCGRGLRSLQGVAGEWLCCRPRWVGRQPCCVFRHLR